MPHIKSRLAGLSCYALRHTVDFDKYTALSMAEDIGRLARLHQHDKAAFLDVATHTLHSYLDKSQDHFCAYFLALFPDKNYKILDPIAKVDKAFEAPSSGNRPVFWPVATPCRDTTFQLQNVVCFYCGVPGHMSPRCFWKMRQASNCRFTPYRNQRLPPGGRPGPQ
ncbi:LIGHT-DEPENDENT SHORT HYPOCOTYLS 6 [Paramuricea clavata]|uniref:LIGHT-DEPENDENT SHORT HYPOCOTYLS 6 n=1 Tax=Paramuricea clavata TaxID=317549 RepID=A0A6S7LNU2_PARCT|nr:LIGHT-DEPENDENT SHORT HYPOCOTYLS 6 [Paramuricea clavata]